MSIHHPHDMEVGLAVNDHDAAALDANNSALIAEAVGAAVRDVGAHVLNDADVTAAANAAAMEVVDEDMQESLGLVPGHESIVSENDDDEAAKKNSQRRKRYREKYTEQEVEAAANQQHGVLAKKQKPQNHADVLAQRRQKDRERYANMTPEQRHEYNEKRRKQVREVVNCVRCNIYGLKGMIIEPLCSCTTFDLTCIMIFLSNHRTVVSQTVGNLPAKASRARTQSLSCVGQRNRKRAKCSSSQA
jgi:hypothetical protein